MIARKPDIHAADAPIVWSRIPEFSQYWNGASIIIPHVEHYLVNIISGVRKSHGASRPELDKELELFIQQETTHSMFHLQFNKRMYEAGYDKLKPLIEVIKGELRDLREKRSLAFNLAYCAGFENAALFSAKYMFEACDDLFEGADVRGADLFLWHVAEEFEHRSVCHDAFMAVSGSYWTRMHGLLYSFWHIDHCFKRAAKIIFDHHRQTLSPAERRESERREAQLTRRMNRYVLPKMLQLLLPAYNPAQHAVPDRIQAALDFYAAVEPTSQRFGFSMMAPDRASQDAASPA